VNRLWTSSESCALCVFVHIVEISWSEWSQCSQTCGKGQRKRVMMCDVENSYADENGLPSDECLKALQNVDVKECYLQDCPGTNIHALFHTPPPPPPPQGYLRKSQMSVTIRQYHLTRLRDVCLSIALHGYALILCSWKCCIL